jgi:hypothetical protein
MRLKSAIAVGVALAAIGVAASAADYQRFRNGSFENRFDGWVVDEDQVQRQFEAYHRNEFGAPDNCPGDPGAEPCAYVPVDGVYMAALQANLTDAAVLLSQTFSTEGGRFSGSAAFLGEDFLPWNDSGFVRLYQLADGEIGTTALSENPTQLFFAEIAMVGNWGFTDWTSFSIPLTAGNYRVEIGVTDVNDDREPSVLLVDNFAMTVPEPSAWALMLAGFFGVGVSLRRRAARV